MPYMEDGTPVDIILTTRGALTYECGSNTRDTSWDGGEKLKQQIHKLCQDNQTAQAQQLMSKAQALAGNATKQKHAIAEALVQYAKGVPFATPVFDGVMIRQSKI